MNIQALCKTWVSAASLLVSSPVFCLSKKAISCDIIVLKAKHRSLATNLWPDNLSY
jgi:hypothetical protein